MTGIRSRERRRSEIPGKKSSDETRIKGRLTRRTDVAGKKGIIDLWTLSESRTKEGTKSRNGCLDEDVYWSTFYL